MTEAAHPRPPIYDQYQSPRLRDFDFSGVNEAMAGIQEQRATLADRDPQELILGISGDGLFVSVDALQSPQDGEPQWIVRTGRAAQKNKLLADAKASRHIELTEEGLPFQAAVPADDDALDIETGVGRLHVPGPDQRAQGEPVTLNDIEVIPVEPVPAASAETAEETEARKTRELFGKNVTSFRKILGEWHSTVYDQQTRQPVTQGIVRRLGLDHSHNNAAYFRDYFIGMFEKTHDGSNDTFFEYKGFATRPEARFYGLHCIWQLDPGSGQAQVSYRHPETGEYSPFESMDRNDQAQLRFSMFDAYDAAQRNFQGYRVWEEWQPTGAKALGKLGLGRK